MSFFSHIQELPQFLKHSANGIETGVPLLLTSKVLSPV